MMTPAIVFKELTRNYGNSRGITSLDLEVERGEVFGFLGPNGAGKTTTIRCMAGLLKPNGGGVQLLGLDPIADHRTLAPRVGYLPGELRLYEELTGEQHLELLGNLQGKPTPRRSELCERLELSESVLKRSISGYSRGMKQKIGLVQAFQHEPDLVILDEPTEGLDPLIQQAFFSLLEETKAAGRTVFLSSHVLAEVQHACGRVAILRDGKLVTVQEVAALRDLSARRVRITFSNSLNRDELVLDGAWSPTWMENTVQLLISRDDVAPALRRLLAFDVVDVVAEEADLDEAFLTFYRAPQEGSK